MENYTQTTRFILSCNYSSKIIDPIQSRCAVFRFRPLPKVDILKLVDTIASKEGIKVSDDAKEALFTVCEGDCRRLENLMQSASSLDKDITEKTVFSLASVARPKEVNDVLALALGGDFLKARQKLLDVMLNYGLSGLDVIKQVQREIYNLDVEARKKMRLVERCGECEYRMSEGSDEFVQLEAFLANVTLIGSE